MYYYSTPVSDAARVEIKLWIWSETKTADCTLAETKSASVDKRRQDPLYEIGGDKVRCI